MKNKSSLIIPVILIVLIIASNAAADAGLYPIGQQTNPQQTYPVPQYNPYQQQMPYNYNYNYPYYPYTAPNPAPDPSPWQNQQQYVYPQQYNNNPQPNQQQGPYYDPSSGLYFYPIQEQNQPNNPNRQNNNVQVYTQWGENGTLNMTWTIRNTTGENWDRSNIDIKCTSGCYLLSDPNRTLWDIPYTVKANDKLSFTVNIRQPGPWDDTTMSFAMVAGSKTLYTFTVKPF